MVAIQYNSVLIHWVILCKRQGVWVSRGKWKLSSMSSGLLAVEWVWFTKIFGLKLSFQHFFYVGQHAWKHLPAGFPVNTVQIIPVKSPQSSCLTPSNQLLPAQYFPFWKCINNSDDFELDRSKNILAQWMPYVIAILNVFTLARRCRQKISPTTNILQNRKPFVYLDFFSCRWNYFRRCCNKDIKHEKWIQMHSA